MFFFGKKGENENDPKLLKLGSKLFFCFQQIKEVNRTTQKHGGAQEGLLNIHFIVKNLGTA